MDSVLTLLALSLPPLAPGGGGLTARAAASEVALHATEGPLQGIEARIARGRALLEEGKADEAATVFEEALAAPGAGLRARMWLARAWIALGRFDDALLAGDALARDGARSGEREYLQGLAFFSRAQQAVRQGTAGPYTQSEFEDAVALLSQATGIDAEAFEDAFLPLAEAAWMAQDLEAARRAVERGVALRPGRPEAHALRGRIALSQYVAAGAGRGGDAADAHWQAARASFERAAELLGEPADEAPRRALAEVLAQLGDVRLWKNDVAGANRAYQQALSWDPGAVDFARVHAALGPELFLLSLGQAEKAFAERHGPLAPGAALIGWWKGFAQFQQKAFAEAEATFRAVLREGPQYLNSWFYVFRSAYSQREYEEAMQALFVFEDADPGALSAALQGERDLNLKILDFLVGWCGNAELQGGESRNLDAARLSGILTRLVPDVARYWNNLGLFLRDEGDLVRTKDEHVDPAVLAGLWERAYAAYLRTLELEPENPAYLNDTAVMLHYYLDRDLDTALAMYAKAAQRAEAELERKDLAPDVREWMQIAKRDSNDNLRKLKKELEERARKAAQPARPPR